MSRLTWTSEHHFTVDGVAYRVADLYPGEGADAQPGEMVILKPRDVIERHEALVTADRPRTILELGIFAGGSTALLAQIAQPDRLVALDHTPTACRPLERFIADHDLSDRVRTFYGIDQADADQLDRVVAEGFDGPIDLVIDDASHLEAQTRASFNRLFPRIRPGGAYVIEDWSWPHTRFPHPNPSYQDVTPLSALVCELVLAAACRPQVVAQVVVDDQWTLVRRGPRELDPAHFRISTYFDPVGAEMVERMSLTRTLAP
jgi:predicted O-methyltransferase YrrM